MVNTLVKQKKATIMTVRKAILDRGYLEEVEYDSINIEPVLIYSKSDKKVVFVRHKWDTVAAISVQNSMPEETKADPKYAVFRMVDEDGNIFLKFHLPDQEKNLLEALDEIFPN